jgi:hypothetical protein
MWGVSILIIKGFVSNSVNSCSFIMVVLSKKLAGSIFPKHFSIPTTPKLLSQAKPFGSLAPLWLKTVLYQNAARHEFEQGLTKAGLEDWGVQGV